MVLMMAQVMSKLMLKYVVECFNYLYVVVNIKKNSCMVMIVIKDHD
jgi:hypothetical protein